MSKIKEKSEQCNECGKLVHKSELSHNGCCKQCEMEYMEAYYYNIERWQKSQAGMLNTIFDYFK